MFAFRDPIIESFITKSSHSLSILKILKSCAIIIIIIIFFFF